MAKNTTTITTNDSSTLIAKARKPRHTDSYVATIHIYGTFGSGTIALKTSPDAGTTKLAAKDLSGTAYTTAAADSVNIELGCGNATEEDIYIYADLSGATNPSITITVHDNLG